jgi:sugar lactone lactonase YvrE
VSERAERFTEPCTFHGEGPFWDAVHNRLLLVDMLAGAVVDVAADGTAGPRTLGSVAARPPRRDGRTGHPTRSTRCGAG